MMEARRRAVQQGMGRTVVFDEEEAVPSPATKAKEKGKAKGKGKTLDTWLKPKDTSGTLALLEDN